MSRSALALLACALLACALLPAPVPAQSENVVLLGRHDRGESYTAPDGTELAISGTSTGTSFVDATNPVNPIEIAFIPGPQSGWREFATFGPYCYIVTEGTGAALQVVGLADPVHPTLVRTLNPPDVPHARAHEIKADPQTGFLYVAGTRNGAVMTGLLIFDLNADPVNPPLRGTWTTYYAHDLSLLDGRAYVACIQDDRIAVLDVSQPGTPPILGEWTYPPPVAPHNTWPTADGRHLVTTDETTGGHLRMWDISNLALPVQTDAWMSPNNAVVHNAYIRGDYCFMSHYSDGLRVVDIRDPGALAGVGWYDTGNAWGCWCYAADPTIAYISDINNGTFILRFVPPIAGAGDAAGAASARFAPLAIAPSPFRSSVTVRLGLAGPQSVRLAVYDIAGRLVRILAERDLPAGESAIVWDGRSAAGEAVASGVYTLRLESESVAASHRVVRLR